jgi:hypothetical protein
MALRRRKGAVVSSAENNTKGGVRTDLMAVKILIKRTDENHPFVLPAIRGTVPFASSIDKRLELYCAIRLSGPPPRRGAKAAQNSSDFDEKSACSKKAKGGSQFRHEHCQNGGTTGRRVREKALSPNAVSHRPRNLLTPEDGEHGPITNRTTLQGYT